MRVKKLILRLSISLCTIMPSVLPVYVLPLIGDVFNGTTTPVVVDERVQNIDQYFASKNLPLAGYGETFVEVADKYDLDYRLLPAIAMRESTAGKNACPNDKDNVFGWNSCKTSFISYEQAIDKVGAHLAGEVSSTKGYYNNKTVWKKLRTYNSVIAPYPDQVVAIMNKIEKAPIDESDIKVAKVDAKESKDLAVK